ncbi:MAG: cellulase family glycosylhydrolase [Anaerolineae bacterium]|nr:cellulase family glycosylhydrolase [Anaerolineae bacterium]
MLSITWRTGVNMREFAYYGTDVLAADPENQPHLQDLQLESLRSMQVKLVRFYASHHRFTVQQSIEALRMALQKLQAYGMQAIICLDDSVRDSGFFVPGNRDIPKGKHGHYQKVYFRDKLYRVAYMPHVEAIVREFASDRTVLIWELCNESQLTQDPPLTSLDAEAYYEFAQEASRRIKDIAPNQLVSLGLASVRHVLSWDGSVDPMAQARRLYALPTVDVVSTHLYAEDGDQESAWRDEYDVAVAQAVRKPLYLGEVGAHPGDFPADYRFNYLQEQLGRWHNLGAFSVLPWQFNECTADLGISDGMARRYGDGWFDGLKNLLASYGAAVDPVVVRGSRPSSDGSRRVTRSDPPPFRYFRVLRDGLLIYSAADVHAPKVPRTLKSGVVIKVDSKSRCEKQGYVWWQFDDGWVIERAAQVKVKRLQVYLQEVTTEAMFGVGGLQPRAPGEILPNLRFRVKWQDGGGIYIRKRPAKNARILGDLKTGEEVEVFADSRREINGIIWWQHARGWSAERPVRMAAGDQRAFMELVGPVERETPTEERVRFHAVTAMRVRSEPDSLDDKNIIGEILEGDIIEAYPESRTLNEADQLIWWQHANGRPFDGSGEEITGWTAERGINGTPVYLEHLPPASTGLEIRRFTVDPDDPFDVNLLPARDRLFQRLPIGNKQWVWVQHFGNTSFAQALEGEGYKYACMLHGGLDLGNSRLKDWNDPTHRVPVVAGIESGVVLTVDNKHFRPAYVSVKVVYGSATYEIIYGHLHPTVNVAPGDPVGPETQLGYIATRDLLQAANLFFDAHLHLEIRYKGYILNPLLFIPNEYRDRIVANQPEYNRQPHFYPYEKWQTPFDQPVIKRNGPPMGPRA